MATRRGFRCVVLLLLFGCAAGLLYFIEQLRQHLNDINMSTSRTDLKERTTSTGLKVIHPSQFANETGFKCLKVNVEDLIFPICVYDAEDDIFVSKPLYFGGYYEKDMVTKFLTLLKTREDVTFVDLGANIGLYTLPMAHLGRHVVAVEPNPDTYRRLAKSIHLGRVSRHIDAVNYALADVDQSTAVLNIDLKNRGNSFFTNTATSGPVTSVLVPTTTLDRLLPLIRNRKVAMKVDVQESEIKIFTETGAGEFFKTVNVSIIMMEWAFYPESYGKDESSRCMVNRFLEFFYKRGYEVYDPRSENKLSPDWKNWPFDVLFKKRGLPTDTSGLFSI